MTIKQLIEKLKEYDENLTVINGEDLGDIITIEKAKVEKVWGYMYEASEDGEEVVSIY
jgi:hypothetical protein